MGWGKFAVEWFELNHYEIGTSSFNLNKLKSIHHNSIGSGPERPIPITTVNARKKKESNLGGTQVQLKEPSPNVNKKKKEWLNTVPNKKEGFEICLIEANHKKEEKYLCYKGKLCIFVF
ncbi:unnamed protein product [Rhizophagus irregularis]|nr:unnamed protein product [Rhizophagus irregularis]